MSSLPNYLELTYKATKLFIDANPGAVVDHNIIEYACRYFYQSLDRKVLFAELNKVFKNKDTVNAVMILVACMKDLKYECFPRYQIYCDALRAALAQP